ncbi:hypothetical protein HGG72_09295 [Ochrobactrum pecoris]|uniref:Uncharacterized protein n=1 Tax=Brucella pecoris TaxID=867683 RepID=A0A5C5CTE6_9HYPH|nr:hypothetical protein [Brucella pecoris]MBB4092623.1 hypothetical protein [Brucella pecoris]NKW80495.1 hypothetical protein [Brucella pecoris]TNV14447.1 hypothetical protein FIB18_04240 [Brucella pecoris]
MANWRKLEAMVDQKMTRSYGESVRLSFMKKQVVDPDRPTVDIIALLHVGGDDSRAPGPTGTYRSRLSLGEAELFLDRSIYSGPDPKVGDKVRANDRAGKPWFEVAAVSDRYSNLIVVKLGQI